MVGSTCVQGGAVYIVYGQGTFTNCNFTSNSVKDVSLEEEHVDDCEMSECITLSCALHVYDLTNSSLLCLSYLL